MFSDPTMLTYYGGLAIGAFLIFSVVIVFVITRKLNLGGGALALIGLGFFGLSIWKSLDINVPKGEFRVELRFQEARAQSPSSTQPNLSPSVAAPVQYKISIVNQSTAVGDQEISVAVAALRKQIINDLAPVWGISAELNMISRDNQAPSDTWTLLILDDSDQFEALGYHNLSSDGLPQGKVFVKTAQEVNFSWTLTASHELLNMLVDPRINTTIFVGSTDATKSGGKLYAQEIAGPCEDGKQGYRIGGILVSDFVYPNWFEPASKAKSARFDQTGHVGKPLEICPGGYISTYEITGGEWKQEISSN
jgi:hypothetical protein